MTEKCVQEQIRDNSVVAMKNSEYQNAYKEGHSCKTTLIKNLNDLCWAVENQKISVLVLLDLSSASDMVDHDNLLQVLEKKIVSKIMLYSVLKKT